MNFKSFKTLLDFPKAVMILALVVMLGMLASPAHAGIVVAFTSVTGPVAGQFTWTYTVTLSSGAETQDPNSPGPFTTFFTIYDIVGLVPGSEGAVAGWASAEHVTGDTPAGVAPTDGALTNITWTYTNTGTEIVGPAPLGTFTFKSTVGNATSFVSYSEQDTKNNPGSGDDHTRIANFGSVIGPTSSALSLSCPSSTGQQGVPYTGALVASGGVPAYTYSIFSGALPPVLLLNAATGAITGTPTGAGTFSFVGKVVDSTSGTALTTTVSCSITITSTGGGCPATKGFWHDPSKHGWPNAAVSVGGVSYEGAPLRGMTIGGIHYTQDQLLQLMPGAPAEGSGYVIAGSQLVAAVLNIASGGQHNSTADNAIKTTNDLLAVDGRMVGTAYGVGTAINYSPSPANNGTLVSSGDALDNYNSAKGLGCSEASGLSLGSQPQPSN